MSASNRKSVATSTSTPTPVREQTVRAVHDISRYTFEYQRDRVSRKAGASYFRVEGLTGDEGLEMSLQEAQSLYNFLGKALKR